MDESLIDATPEMRDFVLAVLRNQRQGVFPERPNEEIPEGEHNWRYIEADIHTHMIPSYFSGCFKCGAMLKPKSGHWRTVEKAQREAPPCPGEINSEALLRLDK